MTSLGLSTNAFRGVPLRIATRLVGDTADAVEAVNGLSAAVYTPESADAFAEREVASLVQRAVQGINVALLALRENTQIPSAMFQLTGTAVRGGAGVAGGLPPMKAVCDALFASLHQVGNASFQVVVQYVYLSGVQVVDLLADDRVGAVAGDMATSVVADELVGAIVRGASARDVSNAGSLWNAVLEGGRRRSMQPSTGMAGAAAVFTAHVLQQRADGEALLSKIVVAELPSLQAALGDFEAAQAQQGTMSFRNLQAFLGLVRDLEADASVESALQHGSPLNMLIGDALGGSALSTVVWAVAQRPHDRAVRIVRQLQNIVNYPAQNVAPVVGVLRKLRTLNLALSDLLKSAQQQRLGAEGGSAEEELRGKVLEAELMAVKQQDEAERARVALAQLREKYNELVAVKADLYQQLLHSEEERLQVSKALVDVRLENATAAEQAENDKYELMSRILAFENDMLQVEMKLEAEQTKARQLEQAMRGADQERTGLQTEFAALKHNYMQAVQRIEQLETRNDDLNVDIVNLVNAKEALQREVDMMRSGQSSTEVLSGQLTALRAQLEDANARLSVAEREKAKVELRMEQSTVEYQQRLLEMTQQMQGASSNEPGKVDRVLQMQEQLMGEWQRVRQQQTSGRESRNSVVGGPKMEALMAENERLRGVVQQLQAAGGGAGAGGRKSQTAGRGEVEELRAELEQRAQQVQQLQQRLEQTQAQAQAAIRAAGSRQQAAPPSQPPVDLVVLQKKLEILQRENEQLKEQMFSAAEKQSGDQNMVGELKKFTMGRQQQLERERMELLTRATAAESQVESLQQAMQAQLKKAKAEIAKLRRQLAEAGGAGGGGGAGAADVGGNGPLEFGAKSSVAARKPLSAGSRPGEISNAPVNAWRAN